MVETGQDRSNEIDRHLLEERMQFRSIIPKKVWRGYRNILLEEKVVSDFQDADVGRDKMAVPEKPKEEASVQPTSTTPVSPIIREGAPVQGKIIVPGKRVSLRKLAKDTPYHEPDKPEFDREKYQRDLKSETFRVLDDELTSDKGREISSEIQETKVSKPEISLFNLLQEKLRDRMADPDTEIENGLTNARAVLLKAAKEAGVFVTAKDLLQDAQRTNDFVSARDKVKDINISDLDRQATKLLESRSSDYGGMNDEYVDVAGLNMDLAQLRAEGRGTTKEAKDLKREIKLRGWGNPPQGLEKMARDHLEGVKVKLAEKEEKQRRRKVEYTISQEALTKKEWKEVDELEKAVVESVIESYMRKAVDAVGDNQNIYPYEHRGTVEFAIQELKEFSRKWSETLDEYRKGNEMSEKEKIIFGRLDNLTTWMEGNGAMLMGAGNILTGFFDGHVHMMHSAVKRQPRYDITSSDLHKLYSSLGEAPQMVRDGGGQMVRDGGGQMVRDGGGQMVRDGGGQMVRDGGGQMVRDEGGQMVRDEGGKWTLGKDITEKQDRAFAIMRGIAAAHRTTRRNGGKETVFDDYPINENQAKFIEMYFGRNAPSKGVELKREDIDAWLRSKESLKGISFKLDGEVQTLESIKGRLKNDEDKIEVEIERKNLEVLTDLIPGSKAIEKLETFYETDSNKGVARKIVIGQEMLVSENNLRGLSVGRLRGKSLWVDGIEWPINRATLVKLEDKIGSGDKVFIGEKREVNESNYKRRAKARKNKGVGLIEETPREINNLFVMDQQPQEVKLVKKKIAAMMKANAWERLGNGESLREVEKAVEAELVGENKDLGTIDRHIIDMSRISLLYFLEGSRLGWGFEYSEEDVGKGKEKTKIIKRGVSSGGTKAATDISAPFQWLREEASSTWKEWTSGTLSMDQRSARQILDHEPGWAPSLSGDKWKITYMGVPMEYEVNRTFKMSLLESAVIKSGEHQSNKLIELVLDKNPKNMSELPWRHLLNEAPYRWYINLSQAALAVDMLKVPSRETMAKFYGDTPWINPRTAPINEQVKRLSLTFRDWGESEDAQRFLPFAAALNQAWRNNLVLGSESPGKFNWGGDVLPEARTIKLSLEQLNPSGETDVGLRMSDDFWRYTEQFKKPALKLRRQTASQQLTPRFLRRRRE